MRIVIKYGSIFEDKIRNSHPTGTYHFAALDCTIRIRITLHIYIYIYRCTAHTHIQNIFCVTGRDVVGAIVRRER